jgi:hypothetical protein
MRRLTALCLAALLALPSPALASPPVSKLLKEQHRYLQAAKHIRAEVRALRGPPPPFPLIDGARGAVERGLLRSEPERWTTSAPTLRPEIPAGERLSLVVERGKSLTLGDDRLPLEDLKLKRGGPELRLLALALASLKIEKEVKRLGKRLPFELLTLDRIDDRYVWAVGDADVALWLDRETSRPTRLELGPNILDEHHWTLELHYDDEGPGRGWFPQRLVLLRDREPTLTLFVTAVEL